MKRVDKYTERARWLVKYFTDPKTKKGSFTYHTDRPLQNIEKQTTLQP